MFVKQTKHYSSMIIRKANPEDAKDIAPLILLAMEDIVYNFIGEKSKSKSLLFLEEMISQPNNQYSYENCFVVEKNNEIIAASIVYDGAELVKLRQPVAEKIKAMFNKDFLPEEETEKGEFYIDTLGVSPKAQGKGIGSKLLNFLIDEYVYKRKEKLGLLVDKENPNAKTLYLKLGFRKVCDKTLVSKELEHLRYER